MLAAVFPSAQAARAALELGPVKYRCNSCGCAHTASSGSDSPWECLARRCGSAWRAACDLCDLARTRRAAVELIREMNALQELYPGYGVRGLRMDWAVCVCLPVLEQIACIVDGAEGGGGRDQPPAWGWETHRAHRAMWPLMIRSDQADAQTALAPGGLVDGLRRLGARGLDYARRAVELCLRDDARRDAIAACDAFQAELDRLGELVLRD